MSTQNSPLAEKSLQFAIDIVRIMRPVRGCGIVKDQILRAATSIGANINEANYGQSKADFVSKMHIALKETAETEYWLKLLTMSEYITEDMGQSLLKDCLEIKRMLIASINTAKESAK